MTAREQKLTAWLAEAMHLLHIIAGTLCVVAGLSVSEEYQNDSPDDMEKLIELAQSAIARARQLDADLTAAGLDNALPDAGPQGQGD